MGLHALYYLALEPTTPHSAEEIAQYCGGSKAHLQKVLRKMVAAGFIAAKRGPGGGFYLPEQGERLHLLWVFELLGGPFTPQGCGLNHESPCLIGTMIDELRLTLRDFLADKTLDDLMKYENKWPRIRLTVRALENGRRMN